MAFTLFMDCWTLPIICTNAVVASVGSLTPLPWPFTICHVTTPHFLWGAFLPHSLPGNLAFPPSSSLSDRQGAQGGPIQPPFCGGRPVIGEWGGKEPVKNDSLFCWCHISLVITVCWLSRLGVLGTIPQEEVLTWGARFWLQTLRYSRRSWCPVCTSLCQGWGL